MTTRYDAIIFDFDYTLVDSSQGVVECINYALTELQLPQVRAAAVHRTIGLHLDDAFVQLAGERHAALRGDFRRHFAQRADEVMNDLTLLFETVPDTVQHLKKNDIQLAIVSTKYRYRIADFLQREHLLEAFDVIIGGEDVVRHKPDPEGLLQAIVRLNSPFDKTLYVGDSVVDAEAAQRAGLPFVAVLSGVTDRGEFDGYPVLAEVANLSQLTEWLMEIS
ncbi:MAG: HAD family hydrolase [Desulfuromonadaceae bacterium]